MFGWLLGKLGVGELRERVSALEGRADNLEREVGRGMRHLGGYKGRTDKELSLMKKQITDLLATVESIIKTNENMGSLNRATQLKRRLKNNLTRINNTMERGKK